MAELSENDKKILLGADYKWIEAQKDAQLGTTDQTRLAQTRKNTAANITSGAVGIGLVAFAIGVANYYSRGTNYSSTLVIGCIVVVLASAVTIAFMRYRQPNL